jgi:hypothetical protein
MNFIFKKCQFIQINDLLDARLDLETQVSMCCVGERIDYCIVEGKESEFYSLKASLSENLKRLLEYPLEWVRTVQYIRSLK